MKVIFLNILKIIFYIREFMLMKEKIKIKVLNLLKNKKKKL